MDQVMKLSLDIVQGVIMCDSLLIWSVEPNIEPMALYRFYFMIFIIITRLEFHIFISLKEYHFPPHRKILTVGTNYF